MVWHRNCGGTCFFHKETSKELLSLRRQKVSLLVDTDIIIFGIKGNESVRKAFKENESLPKAISVITYGELLHGAKKIQ